MTFDPPLTERQLADWGEYLKNKIANLKVGDTITLPRPVMFVLQPSKQRWLLLKLRIKHGRPMSDRDWWEYCAGAEGAISFVAKYPPPTRHTLVSLEPSKLAAPPSTRPPELDYCR